MAELTRRDFRAAILYDYKRGLSVDECCRSLKLCFGELVAPSRTTVFNRYRDIKSGRVRLDDSLMQVNTVYEFVEKVREQIQLDPGVSQLEIAQKFGLDLGVVQTIVVNVLKLGWLNSQWTPVTLSDSQRVTRKDWTAFMLETFNDVAENIVACFDTWIYKCCTVKKSTRITSEYWTFDKNSSRVVDKRMVICFFSVTGINVVASLNNLRLLSSGDLVDSCLRDVMDDWTCSNASRTMDKSYLYIETLTRCSPRLLDFLQDRRTVLINLPDCSADLALGRSFLQPSFWTGMHKQRFAAEEDAVIEYKNCLNAAVPEMWSQLFANWFKRMRKCVECDGDYVEPINFNLDLSGCDAASIMVNPNSVMPSHGAVRTLTPTVSSSSAESSAKTTTTSTAASTTTTNGVKRHFNFTPKVEPKQEKIESSSLNGQELEDGEADGESDNERDYENEASESEDEEDDESDDEDVPGIHATAQPHGLKLTIPSSNGQKSKTTLLLPASTIKTISPQLIKAQQAHQQALKVNGITGIRLQNFKILGQTNGNVQQLRRQIYNSSVQAHIVTAQAQQQQQQQQLLQQQLAAAAAAAASSSPNAARKTDKDLDSLSQDYDDKAYPKPAYSYSCLIAMALKNSQTGSLPVSEIYNFMCEHFPYFKTAPNGWKNSVRHNLSLNKCFEKIEKPAGNGNQRKGCLWAINPAKVAKMDEEVQKWSRKDPLAIKKAMIYPDHLELLERGEMKFVGSGSNGDLSEETESSGDEVEGPDETVHSHQLAANSVTDSYDESSQDCDVDVSEQLYDEIDIDENKDSLHMQLNISKQDDYQLSPSTKRQKTLTGTLQANYVYQPVATARRKTPLFLTTAAATGSYLKLE